MLEALQNGAFLIDVRSLEEYDMGHFKESQHIPLENLFDAELPADLETPIYLHCRTGRRVLQAQAILQERGYQNLTNLGGIEDVENIGLAFQGDWERNH